MDITNPNSAQPSVAIPSVMPEEASTDGLSAWADIDLSAISDNVAQLGRLAGDADVMAVIKGDAYGHGLAPVAGAALGSSLAFALVVAAAAVTHAAAMALRMRATRTFGGVGGDIIGAGIEISLVIVLVLLSVV